LTQRDGNNIYEVTVVASDGTGGLDSQTLSIKITGGNDAPDITSDGGAANALVNVSENQTAVTTVAATDIDGDTLSYAITGGADQSLFSIDSNTGDITFVSAPDFENPTDANLDNTYEVQVQVSDGNGGFDVQTIAVAVADATDAPVITSNGGGTSATINVQENQTAVTTVTATDQDAGATLTYAIGGGVDQALFTIDPVTGVLTFNSPPDFDAPADANGDNSYEVDVQVTDDTGAVATQMLTVDITDVNQAPTIVSDGGVGVANLNVAENTTAITTVAATDPDGDALTYLISGGIDAAQFTLDSATGELSFLTGRDFENPLDFDGNGEYIVQVQAYDPDGLFSTQLVRVTVADVNEAPVVPGGSGTSAVNTSINETTTTVTTVTATDVEG